jgi:hypothetical protein
MDLDLRSEPGALGRRGEPEKEARKGKSHGIENRQKCYCPAHRP